MQFKSTQHKNLGIYNQYSIKGQPTTPSKYLTSDWIGPIIAKFSEPKGSVIIIEKSKGKNQIEILELNYKVVQRKMWFFRIRLCHLLVHCLLDFRNLSPLSTEEGITQQWRETALKELWGWHFIHVSCQPREVGFSILFYQCSLCFLAQDCRY